MKRLALLISATVLGLAGCVEYGYHTASITLPNGSVAKATTFGPWSESAKAVADAATRVMAVQRCTEDPALKKTDGCQKLLAEEFPANDAGKQYNGNGNGNGHSGGVCPTYSVTAFNQCFYGH